MVGGKRRGMPLILMDGNDVIILCGKSIITRLPLTDISKAFVVFMSLFYLMDLDYPQSHEVALTIMQYLIFEDKKTPVELIKAVDANWVEYTMYKGANQ